MKSFINELGILGCRIEQVPLAIDNNSALKLSKNPEFHSRSKHIDLKYHYIREKVVETKDIHTERVDTKENVADIMTKMLPRQTHEYLVGKMGMVIAAQGEHKTMTSAIQGEKSLSQGES